jgi:hypothetical protein
MSIAAVMGVSAHAAFQPLSGATKPESAEVAGAPDHDGDSDDHGAKASAPSRSGSVDVIA